MITLDAIRKTYRSGATSHAAIGNVSLTIGDGEFVSIVGPSGCGKSTLLNLIAGFIAPSAGEIRVKDQLVQPGHVPSRLGYLFQKDVVLPWLTVEQNVGLGLRFAHMPAAQIREKVSGLLKLANLRGYENYFPYQLSGGMRQRTALLMTLACDPRVLLLDEPFGALDALTREELSLELSRLWQELGRTALLITHDIEEAILLGDRVLIMSERPGTIRADIAVDLPRPRNAETVRLPRFQEIKNQVRDIIFNRAQA